MGPQILPEELKLYLRHHLILIPLKPLSKEPLVRWGNNWGIRCGGELAVLDFDSEASFYDFIQSHPEAVSWPRVKTGWLGHANIGTTMRYRKVAGQELKEWYERLWSKREKGNG